MKAISLFELLGFVQSAEKIVSGREKEGKIRKNVNPWSQSKPAQSINDGHLSNCVSVCLLLLYYLELLLIKPHFRLVRSFVET